MNKNANQSLNFSRGRNLKNFSAKLRVKYLFFVGEYGMANFHSYDLFVSESWSPLYMADRVIKLDLVSPPCPQPETEKWNRNEPSRIRQVSVQSSGSAEQGWLCCVAQTCSESVPGGQPLWSVTEGWVCSTAVLKWEVWYKSGSPLEVRAPGASWKVINSSSGWTKKGIFE